MAPERDGQSQPFVRHPEEEQISQSVLGVDRRDVAVGPESLNDAR